MFSVPFNNDFDNYEELVIDKKLHDIKEVYFALPSNVIGNARDRVHFGTTEQYIALTKCLHKYGIEPVLIINSGFTPMEGYTANHYELLLKVISTLGIYKVTLANNYYAAFDFIRKNLPGVKVEASINCMYDTFDKVRRAVEMFGYDSIVIDRCFNRDLEQLDKVSSYLKKAKVGRKILVNEGCLVSCPFKREHDSLIGQSSYCGASYQEYKNKIIEHWPETVYASGNLTMQFACGKVYKEKPWLFLESPFIRPEDLNLYLPYADVFKIAGRTKTTERIAKLIGFYSNRSFEKDVWKLVENGAIDCNKYKMPNKELEYLMPKLIAGTYTEAELKEYFWRFNKQC